MKTSEYRKVRLKDIVVREPIRTYVDPKGIAELAESMKQQGLHEPIVVRPEGDAMVLVAGLRRTKAAEKLGWEDIDAHVETDLSPGEAEEAALTENLQRQSLNAMEEARAVERIIAVRRTKEPGASLEVIGARIQMSGSDISNTLRRLKLPKSVQKLLEDRRITPGHVEHAIGPLADKLTEKEVVAFAHRIAAVPEKDKEAIDVHTAGAEAARLIERRDTELAAEAAVAGAKKAGAKVVYCPECKRLFGINGPPDKSYESGGRLVLEHKTKYDREVHRWYGDTGEFYLTPAELKELEREKAAQAKARKAAKPEKREKVVRDYAVFFSRAPIDKWAQALLDAGKGSLRAMTIGSTYGGANWSMNEVQDATGALVVDATFKVPKPLRLSEVDLKDDKGRFLTRVQIGYYRSTPSEDDHVVEGPDVPKLRKLRAEVLAFQRKETHIQQANGDLWPTNTGGFSIGEKVKIGDKAEWASYKGKQGPILAFDVDGKELVAVLDIAAAHKRHKVATLKKIEARQKATKVKKAKPAPKGRAK